MDLTQPDVELPQADLITALGVIEYFNATELEFMMARMKAPHFLFDFPDSEGRRKDWATWQLRRVYLGSIIARVCIFTSMMSSMR